MSATVDLRSVNKDTKKKTAKANENRLSSANESDKSVPFYQKKGAIITLLIIFPVAGIPLMFKYMPELKNTTKWIITAVLACIWIPYSIYAVIQNHTTAPANNTSTSTTTVTEAPTTEVDEQARAEQERYNANNILESDYIDIISYIKESMIKPILKAPSTAEFPDGILSPYKGWNISNGEEFATFSSYVDSQNSYGAMIRSQFSVTVCKRNGRIEIASATFDGQKIADQWEKCE